MDKSRAVLTLTILLVLAIVSGSRLDTRAAEPTVSDSKAAARSLPYMAFRSFRHEERFNRQFADAGIRLVFIYPANTICSLGIPYTQYPPNWIGPGRYDFDALDRQINDILAWNPGAKLMCMIDLNTPPWWIESHGGADSFRTFGHVAARDDYRRDAVGSAVDLLIEGHGRFNVPTACTIARQLEPFRPLFFEEPVPPDNLDALAVNLRGYVLCAQYAARQMVARGGGAIVNIGSNTAKRALGDRAAYIASKGGVESLTRAIAVELAEHHIRVNCVVPGYIYTERWDTLPEETRQRRWKNVPLGKESSPEDIGEAAAFLASSKAGNITGSSLLVSGGIDIQLVPPDCAV